MPAFARALTISESTHVPGGGARHLRRPSLECARLRFETGEERVLAAGRGVADLGCIGWTEGRGVCEGSGENDGTVAEDGEAEDCRKARDDDPCEPGGAVRPMP